MTTATQNTAAQTLTGQPLPSIDMFTPDQACVELAVAPDALLHMINHGQLPAYNLGGNIRLKKIDVQEAAAVLTAA